MSKSSRSVFDPDNQSVLLDAKIIAAIDKLSHALRVMLWNSSKSEEESLSPAQIQILVFLLFHDRSLAKVGEISREFMLTPATVSDAVSTLRKKGLVSKHPLADDRRSHTIELTDNGKRAAKHLSGWPQRMLEALMDAEDDDKRVAFDVLLRLVSSLQASGVVQTSRMCLTCRHLRHDNGESGDSSHYCLLLEEHLDQGKLRLDCPEHEDAQTP